MTAKAKFACGFCQRAFTNERTLGVHMCEKKRRHNDKDNVASRMGLGLYQRFYELNTATKNAKTSAEFIDSKYYKAFIKFARHLMDLRPVDQSRFVDYVFRNSIKDRDWCKDNVYEAYILDLLGKEPAQRGLERSIMSMEKWASETEYEYNEFFRYVSPSEATHMVKMGKISPWVLYLAETSDLLWERLSDEQATMIAAIVDPKIWMARFQIKKEECSFTRDILHEAHI